MEDRSPVRFETGLTISFMQDKNQVRMRL